SRIRVTAAPPGGVGHAGRMHEMLKRHEIQVLAKAGLAHAKIAEIAGVSERAVGMITSESGVTDLDDAAERRRRRIGRPSKAEPFREFVREQLEPEPDLPSLELLRRAKLRGYVGAKSAFYALVAAVRPKPERPVVRFEGVAGEF